MRCLIGLTKVVIVGAIAGSMAGGAFAQERVGEEEQVQKNKPVLAGPTVRENRIPGVEESFGGADRMAGMSERPVPMRIFRQALSVLSEEGVNEDHRLSREQEQTLRELGEEHTLAIRTLMADHQEELAELRRAARAQSGETDQAPTPQRGGTDAVSKLRQRTAQIRRMGPSDSALQTKLWNVLSEGQQGLVELELNAWREQMAQDRMDQVTQRYLDQRRDAARTTTDARPQSDRLANFAMREGFNPKLRESIAKLKPEARRRLIERLRKRWIERQEAGSDRDVPSRPTDAPRRRPGG